MLRVSSCKMLVIAMVAAFSGCAGIGARPPEHANAEDDEAQRPRGEQLLEVARVLAKHGDRVRAIQYLALAQRDGVPAQRVVPRLLALYAADGQYRLAIDAAEGYLRRQPNDHKVRRCLGAFYIAVDARDEALQTFETLVAEQPGDANAHFTLASLLAESGSQYARADEHFRTYLALAPAGRYADEARAKLLKVVP